MTLARTSTAVRALLGLGLLLLVVRELTPGLPARVQYTYTRMVLCQRLAHTFGAAGIRAELAYRQAVTDTSLSD